MDVFEATEYTLRSTENFFSSLLRLSNNFIRRRVLSLLRHT